MKTRLIVLLLLAGLGVAGVYWYPEVIKAATPPAKQGTASQSQAKGASHGAAPTAVATQKVVHAAVPVTLEAFGTVQPLATVVVKARIDSEVTSVHFSEGQEVHKGDLLFTLDPRPAQAALAQAQANLARDTALLQRAQADAKRSADLIRKDLVARQDFDSTRSAAQSLQGTVKADEAAIDAARLTLAYTEIRSPIDGRTGAVQLQAGNVVKANDAASTLVTITQMRPISVQFSIPERYLPEVRRAMAASPTPLRVTAGAPGETTREVGQLSFIDNQVNTDTGTVALKATFDNAKTTLWPGQYVAVVLTLRVEDQALVVANQAVQAGQNGQYVFVVGPDDKVEMRPVKIERVIGERTVIASGIQAGDRVVVEGQLRLVPGMQVAERPVPAAAPAAEAVATPAAEAAAANAKSQGKKS